MTRIAALVPAALLLVMVALLGVASGALAGLLGASDVALAPTEQALMRIPPAYLAAYQQAAAGCPGLPWTVLAAIGEVESDHGRSTAPGVASGANLAGAAGPMQMGIGTVWVPDIRSPHATCAYSWISPPSRSRRTTLPVGTTTAASPSLSGGTWPKARCGR